MGASVVNALSEYVEVEVCTGGKMYRQTFRSYEGPDGKMVSGKPMAPPGRGGPRAPSGH